jgi:hypothetical protein
MRSESLSPRQQLTPLILILGQKVTNSANRGISLREKLDNPGQEYKHCVLIIILKGGHLYTCSKEKQDAIIWFHNPPPP